MADVYEKLTELQAKFEEHTPQYYVADHLKRICMADPSCEAILLEDLQNPDMGLDAANKQLYEYGRTLAKGRQGGVGFSDDAAEKVLRKFYGLPDMGSTPAPRPSAAAPQGESMVLDLAAFLKG